MLLVLLLFVLLLVILAIIDNKGDKHTLYASLVLISMFAFTVTVLVIL